MKIKILFKIQILLILSSIINCNCAKSNAIELKENFLLQNKKFQAEVLSETLLNTENIAKIKISYLFDSDPNTFWFLQAGYKGELKFIFSKPVYIEKIIINNNLNLTSVPKYKIQDKKINLNMFKDINSEMSEGFLYNYKVNQKFQEIDFPNYLISSILKTKILTISINDNFAKNFEGILIGDITLELSGKQFFKPSLTIDEIKNKYFIEENNKWLIRVPSKKYKSEELKKINIIEKEVLANLIFLASNGDKRAEKIFYNYSPAGAFEGEYFSFLREWYETSKIQFFRLKNKH